MNDLLKDVSTLNYYFCEQSLCSLQAIFEASGTDTYEITDLKEQLLSVLQLEMSRGLTKWEISQDGENHIVICDNLLLLINIHGFMILMLNWLFFEGELDIMNIQWMETDNLVLFDIYYIVHNEWQKWVCHYSNNNDSFVFQSAIREAY